MVSSSLKQTVGEGGSLRHRCTHGYTYKGYIHTHTHIHRHPSPHPLLLWNLSPRKRYVVVLEVVDEIDDDHDDDDGQEGDNSDRINKG